MQSVSSRVWTRVAVSFSYDDNHYSTGTFDLYLMMLSIKKGSINYYFLESLVRLNLEIEPRSSGLLANTELIMNKHNPINLI